MRVCATVLLGSIVIGVVSPAVALTRVADRLAVDGVDQKTLDAALESAPEIEAPADVAHAVFAALGVRSPASEVFLRALYGHLFQLLLCQQGPKAVTMTALANERPIQTSPGITAGLLPSFAACDPSVAEATAATDVTTLGDEYPAIQALGP